jgi:hypothetical protein
MITRALGLVFIVGQRRFMHAITEAVKGPPAGGQG